VENRFSTAQLSGDGRWCVARNAAADEGAGFISWRWRGQDHCQFWELGVGLFSPALIDYATANLTDTPLPATWTMMLTGVCALGLLGWRKKRKSAAA
jgi:hypothetical protein